MSGKTKHISNSNMRKIGLYVFLVLIFLVKSQAQDTTGVLTDTRDGKQYNWINIGRWSWMTENLAFRPDSGTYRPFDNINESGKKHGYLYDWATAQNVCPPGWRLPGKNTIVNVLSDTSLIILENKQYIKGLLNNLKTTPLGYFCTYEKRFMNKNKAYFWSSTKAEDIYAWSIEVSNRGREAIVKDDINTSDAMFVRCVKNWHAEGLLKMVWGSENITYTAPPVQPDTLINENYVTPGHNEIKIASSMNKFTFDLHKTFSNKNENVFYSPLSIYLAMLLILEGTANETKAELKEALYIENDSVLQHIDTFINAMTQWRNLANFVGVANSVWIDKTVTVNKSYANKLETNYSAKPNITDFKNSHAAVAAINKWVAEKTNNAIKNMLKSSDVTHETLMIICNAIYFWGQWHSVFNESATHQDYFFTSETDSVKTYLMHKTDNFTYYEDNLMQVAEIPYKDKDKSFFVFLPIQKNGIVNLQEILTEDYFNKVLNNLATQRLGLKIPKFKLETDYELKNNLRLMGLGNTFTPNADFGAISNKDSIMLGQIIHKATIDINEKRTVATAATVGTGMAGSPGTEQLPKPILFHARHPFMFMIVDNQTKAILFMGKYVKP
jgi:serpin B